MDVGDLLMVLQAWDRPQPCMTFTYPTFNDNLLRPDMVEKIGVNSVLKLLDHWGPCKGWPIDMRPPDCQ